MWSRNADGTGQPTPVWQEGSYAEGLASMDGEWLVLRNAGLTGGSEGDRDILALRLGSGEEPAPLIATEYIEQTPSLSADTRWLAYESDETGRREVFVRPFPDVESGKWQVSTEGGIAPVWSKVGGQLYFISGPDMMVATVRTDPTFEVLETEVLFSLPAGALIGSGTGSYDVTADDQRFVMGIDLLTQVSSEATPDFILVQNFAEDLRRLAPN